MKLYNRINQGTRKTEDITATPDRTSSSRLQGKEKVARSDSNCFGYLGTEKEDGDNGVTHAAVKDTTDDNGGSDKTEKDKSKGRKAPQLHPFFFSRHSKG